MAGWRAIAWCTCACALLGAQEPPAPPKLLARAADDLSHVAAELEQHAHAFAGSLRANGTGVTDRTFEFLGARHDGIVVLQLEPWTVLQRGHRQLTRNGSGPWTEPQGDAPDCPLSLLMLAKRLATAELRDVHASTFEDRPAMLAHVVWTDKDAAAEVAGDVAVPDSELQRMNEALPRMLQRWPAERWVVDAAVKFDPATKSLLEVTLRVAVLDQNELPAEKVPPAAADGLPPLTRTVLLEIQVQLARQPAESLPLPELTPEQRRQLDPK